MFIDTYTECVSYFYLIKYLVLFETLYHSTRIQQGNLLNFI